MQNFHQNQLYSVAISESQHQCCRTCREPTLSTVVSHSVPSVANYFADNKAL